jgi:hypothetical protein
MKKTMFTLVVAAATFAWAAAQTTTANNPLIVKKATGAIEIDGVSDDAAWGSITAQPVSIKKGSVDQGGFAGTFKFTYDDNNFYLLFEVQDPTFGQVHDATWQSDCVEVFFAMDTANSPAYREKGDWQLRVRAAEEFANVESMDGNHGPGNTWNVDPIKNDPNTKVAETNTGTAYTQEWQLPIATLVEGANFVDNQWFRFDVQLADNRDGAGGRVSQLFWNSNADNQYERVQNQGYIKLETPVAVKQTQTLAKASSIRIKANSIEFAKMAKEVNVYSITGQLMLKARNVNAISTSALKSGVYFVVADGEKAKFVIK